jgi:hypothetical protein
MWGLAGLAAGAGIALAVPRLRRRREDVEDDEAIEPPASAEVLRS